jgi:probable DNA repair protein
MPYAPVPKPELFARLAAGHAARVTVVTPNRRLAQALAREFDQAQAATGQRAWESADILPFAAFVERLYEDARYSSLAARLPLLLGAAQERALWEAVLRASDLGGALLAVPQAAADCARAWELAQGWRLAGALGALPGNEDAEAFAAWSKEYVRRCAREGHTDAARLADVLAPLLGDAVLRKPRVLVAYAFEDCTPQARAFLDACAGAGIDVRSGAPEGGRAQAQRKVFPSARAELEAAAQWARARLEGGAARIGVVVPELGQRRREVARVFARCLHPGHNLPGEERRALPFNLSLGAPLADYPVVRAALSVLELAAQEVPFEQASRLVRSPFIAGASSEMAPRALLDAALRSRAPAKLGLGKLIALIQVAPVLRQSLEKLYAVPRMETGAPHAWARHYTDLLAAIGFPGERSLDSDEFQARAKWNETLAEFARLERVAPKLSAARALGTLRRLCADTLFQPESPAAPIQVLGTLESLGLEFDALWVSGLTDEAWPLRARAHPFLPPALQKKAGIPEASADRTLARCRSITQGWLQAAREVVVSHPAFEEDRALIASPLICGVPGVSGTPQTKIPARYRDLLFAARKLDSFVDDQAPALPTRTPKGGTRILVDQAACPFRAFARHRLRAEALDEPVDGPDAMVRGSLLHALMKSLWGDLKGSAGLQGDVGPAIARAAQAAVDEVKLEEPFAALERTRLAKLAREWLEVERARAPFSVVAREEVRTLAAGGLQLNGRIDRLDRLEAGGHALIDYKTGNPTPNDWLGERPNDPQLPLYALNAAEPVSALAFAKLKTGAMRFTGFARAKDALPKVKEAENWEALLAGWQAELDRLGAGFAAGEARVDPKDLLVTCRYCDLQPLCRVHERLSALGDEGEDA